MAGSKHYREERPTLLKLMSKDELVVQLLQHDEWLRAVNLHMIDRMLIWEAEQV